ncbi:MAG: bifunctional diaminohydroxyphosphoribosylaminopyrimidine deaminase/5-amino-6-(5-phosphoribosylamino)uracil reductase RibD [Halofilum sp. (in: g-proteobacteria)]
MAAAVDAAHMAHALRLAARGLYSTDPNPRVGCVLAHGEIVVGEGFHAVAGGPHAEVEAIAAAGERACGATAYVTLEPCCHHGRTPPCVAALVEAGVSRVVYALKDPNPQVAGQGAAALEAVGVTAERFDSAAAESRALNIGFIKRMATGRPWIRVKLASSLDGGTALASGESRWITGEPARADVHRWRARSSCILTGRGTIAADDPALNVRLAAAEVHEDQPERQPWLAVVDSQLRLPPAARVFDVHERVVVFTTQPDAPAAAALRTRGAEIVGLAGDAAGRVAPAALFAELGRREVNEVHVEAGPTLCGSLLETGYVDEIVLYQAPHLLGDSARGQFHMSPLAGMDERVALHIREVRQVGQDLRIQALPRINRE